MLKTLLRSAIFALTRLFGVIAAAGVVGGFKADVIGDDPDLNALVAFCGEAFRTALRLLHDYPDGCVIGFSAFVVLHAFIVRPGIENQKAAFIAKRASERSKYVQKASGTKAKRKGR